MVVSLIRYLCHSLKYSVIYRFFVFLKEAAKNSFLATLFLGRMGTSYYEGSGINRFYDTCENAIFRIREKGNALYQRMLTGSKIAFLYSYAVEFILVSFLTMGLTTALANVVLSRFGLEAAAVLIGIFLINILFYIIYPKTEMIRGSFFLGWLTKIVPMGYDKKVLPYGMIFGGLIGLTHLILPYMDMIKIFGVGIGLFLLINNSYFGLLFIVGGISLLPTVTIYCVILGTAVMTFLQTKPVRKDNTFFSFRLPFTGFLIATALSVYFSVFRMISLKSFIIYTGYFLMVPVVYHNVKSEKALKWIFVVIAVTAVLLGAMSAKQFTSGTEIDSSWIDEEKFETITSRVVATFDNPNVFAEYLVLAIPLLGAYCLWEKKYLKKFALIGVIGIMGVCLLLTYSRGGWIGMILAVVLFALLKEKRLLGFLVVVLLAIALINPANIMDRFVSALDFTESSNSFRIDIWSGALAMLKDFWYRGVGIGITPFQKLYPNYMKSGTPAVHSHNLFLQMIVEMGIVGFLCFLWLMRNTFSAGLQKMKELEESSLTKYVIAACLAGIIGHVAHGMVDYSWYNPRITFLFWFVVSLCISLTGKVFCQEKETVEEDENDRQETPVAL